MTRTRFHTQHFGELDVQKKRHTPTELAEAVPNYIETEMPAQHAEFFSDLSYLPLATLDKHGRPWASILISTSDDDASIGITVSHESKLSIRVRIGQDDPFYRALTDTKIGEPSSHTLFAGVGVDFSNRRRNKLAGVIELAEREESGILSLSLNSDEHLGNCPKYITVRELAPKKRTPETLFDNFDSLTSQLPNECKEHINKVSTVFLASTHSADKGSDKHDHTDMGLNHRGGNPGFVRVYEELNHTHDDQINTYLVLPDYSGNRFYQSLGNIQSDPLVGLCLADFKSGNVLSLTGVAENLFDNVAQALMPRMSLVTRIRITGAVFIKQAIDLTLRSDEQLSPYNPPIRYLAKELEAMGHAANSEGDHNTVATLVAITELTPTVSTFSFKLSEPIQPPPAGGFGVFDFSELLDTGYSHMNETNPKLVNEDYIRTWTISSAPHYDPVKASFAPTDTLNITVKRKPDGLVSTFLHNQKERVNQAGSDKVQLKLSGIGGHFSCFSNAENGAITVPPNMLWIAGGVGITPFMSMWEELLHLVNQNQEIETDIALVFAGREQDFELLGPFLNDAHSLPKAISISVSAYLTSEGNQRPTEHTFINSTEGNPALSIVGRRLSQDDFKTINLLTEREAYFCGPAGLNTQTKQWLQTSGLNMRQFHEESFSF